MDSQPGMKFLNGLKTVLGAAGMVVSFAVPHFLPTFSSAAPHVIDIAQGAFGLLTVLGLIHKGEKAANSATPPTSPA